MEAKYKTVWDGGVEIVTNCEYDPQTGAIMFTEVSDDGVEGLNCLDREYIELPDGEEIEVCRNCHEYTVKAVMVPDRYNNTLIEEMACRNVQCEYGSIEGL